MKHRYVVAAAACLVAVVLAAFALAQAPAAPKPGPEVQKLGYFVGQWKFEGDSKASAFGPAGKYSGTETCEWFGGRFQVVCHSQSTGPMGKMTGLSVFAYDPETKDYTIYGIDSTGFSVFARGTVAGNTWTYNWTGTIGGKPAKVHATVETSPNGYTGRTEGSIGPGPMALIDTLVWLAFAHRKEMR